MISPVGQFPRHMYMSLNGRDSYMLLRSMETINIQQIFEKKDGWTYVHTGMVVLLYFVSTFSVRNHVYTHCNGFHRYCDDTDMLKYALNFSDLIRHMYLHDRYTYNDHQLKYL